MPTWNLSEAGENQTYYWGKVTASDVRKPNDEYIAAGGRNKDQWTIDIEPLYPFVYEGENIRRKSQNMPARGKAPIKGTPILGRYEAFKNIGFDMPTEDDFALIVGHIFYFCDETRQFGKFEKRDDWPVSLADDFEAPDAPEIYGSDNGGGGSVVDVWQLAAEALIGSDTNNPNELRSIMKASKQELNASSQIMSMAQKKGNFIFEELVKKGLVKADKEGKVVKA
jgi:hypothetical protein